MKSSHRSAGGDGASRKGGIRTGVILLFALVILFSAFPGGRIRGALADAVDEPALIDRWTDAGAWPEFAFNGGEDLLEVWFPRVRDSDATILLYQGECWLIDCGDERWAPRVVSMLQRLGITQIDRLLNTHPHHDHLNGLPVVDAACPVKSLSLCFPEDENAHTVAAVAYARERNIPITVLTDEEVLTMGDGQVRVQCWKKADERLGINDRSGVFMISLGARNLLITGDIERDGQKQLLEALGAERLRADVLRYPHHGKEAMVKRVFEAIDPKFIVVTNTAGTDAVALSKEFLRYLGIPTAYVTGGVLHMSTDGVTWLVEDADPEKSYLLTDKSSR